MPRIPYVAIKQINKCFFTSIECLSNIEVSIMMYFMVDCSHANSNKDAALQPLVIENLANQIAEENRSIIGIMIDSLQNYQNLFCFTSYSKKNRSRAVGASEPFHRSTPGCTHRWVAVCLWILPTWTKSTNKTGICLSNHLAFRSDLPQGINKILFWIGKMLNNFKAAGFTQGINIRFWKLKRKLHMDWLVGFKMDRPI